MASHILGEQRWLEEVWSVSVFWAFLYNSGQLDAIFCIHVAFLANEITHKQTQNSCYTQIVPW